MSFIIGISGASGSGKSTLAHALKNQLSKSYSVALLQQDHYYRDQSHLSPAQRLLTNYDEPVAFDIDLLTQHLVSLKNQQPIQPPKYCFEQHNRLPEKEPLAASDITILEGLMVFNQSQLRPHIDFGVFVDTPLDVCLQRRINRDIAERGRTVDSVVNQYNETVRPMFVQHIEPSKHFADLIWSDFENSEKLVQKVLNHVQDLLG